MELQRSVYESYTAAILDVYYVAAMYNILNEILLAKTVCV